MNNTTESLKQISNDLGLDFEMQDWGIINSSANRVKEFINYFEGHQYFSNALKYALFELIIASFNEALLQDNIDNDIKILFISFLLKYSKSKTFKPILDYWKSIKNSEEYPVGKLL